MRRTPRPVHVSGRCAIAQRRQRAEGSFDLNHKRNAIVYSLRNPWATPRVPAHTHAKVTVHHIRGVHTLAYMCATMIVDGLQPQTYAGIWCGMSLKVVRDALVHVVWPRGHTM